MNTDLPNGWSALIPIVTPDDAAMALIFYPDGLVLWAHQCATQDRATPLVPGSMVDVTGGSAFNVHVVGIIRCHVCGQVGRIDERNWIADESERRLP